MSKTQGNPVRVGIFDRVEKADQAIGKLLEAGFEQKEITVICPQCEAERYAPFDQEDPAGAQTSKAAGVGGSVGALLTGAAAAVGIATTGGSALVIAGPLLAGLGGGVAGGFIGAMMTRGFDKEMADFFDQALEDNQILVGVEDEDEARLAKAEQAFSEAGTKPVPLQEG